VKLLVGWTVLAVAAFGAEARAADAANTMRYGIDAEPNIGRLSQVVAERKGFFTREGLNVEFVSFGISTFRLPPAERAAAEAAAANTPRPSLANGGVHMQRQQLPLLINSIIEGGRTIAVSAAQNNPVYYLAVRPEIRSYADLKGKSVTVTNLRDGITIWTQKLMAQNGLKNDDVSLKIITGSDGRANCLKSGECAGASLAQPQVFQALDAGHHVLGITNELGPQLTQVDVVDPAWAAAHRDLVVKYIRATTAANRYIMDARNREEIVRITMDMMMETEPHARQMVAAITDPKNRVLAQEAPFDMNNVRAAIALMAEYGVVKAPLPAPERFVDASYSQAAAQ
jgi:ABC-type nitrate/sulfonate/bicarbonate transport system substrate-binding protein